MASYKIPMYILLMLVAGGIAYLYFAGGTDDLPENVGIGFVMALLGIIVGGVYL